MRAYEIIKNTWTKQGIWKTRWGILPGISWKYKEPLEEEAVDDVSETALRNAQPLAHIVSTRLENGDAEHPPSPPNSPRPRTGKRPTKGQVLRPSRRKQSEKDASLGAYWRDNLRRLHGGRQEKGE